VSDVANHASDREDPSLAEHLVADPTQWFPMPAALIVSQPVGGRPNLMSIGYVGFTCWQPPIVALGINTARYTNAVIRETRQFVVAVPESGLVRGLDECGSVSGVEQDKFAHSGLTAVPADKVAAPLIAQCPVNLECEVVDVISLGSHDLFLGQVVTTHVAAVHAAGEQTLAPIILLARRYLAASEYLADFGVSYAAPA
jgi:flavin reductase (DIM6/NTAB) family NADH-FMN oxidoreductase RutF